MIAALTALSRSQAGPIAPSVEPVPLRAATGDEGKDGPSEVSRFELLASPRER